MTRYVLNVYQPDGDPPPPEILDPVMRRVAAVQRDMEDAGVWVFTGRLHAPTTATVLRPHDGDVLMTDGPFVEGKEHLGGFTIIEAPDLDAALGWGRRVAEAIGLLPIEVWPLRDESHV